MKNFLMASFVLLSVCSFAQKKTYLNDANLLLKSIKPDVSADSWVLVYNLYSKDQILKTVGSKIDYMPQFSGFKISPNDQGFYYIAYSQGGNWNYIQNLQNFATFIGKPDNGEEAALSAVLNGYFADHDYKDYAANYTEDSKNYYVDMSKITSAECPLAKSHFLVTVEKSTGKIVQEKNLGEYYSIYNKSCTNNPHYDALKVQMEEAKKKEAEMLEQQKKTNAALRKKLEKRMRKD